MAEDINAKLFARARAAIAGGVNSPARAFAAVGGAPLFVARAKGAKIYGADGREYIDYVNSWGAIIAGHADDAIGSALCAAAARGTSFGAPTEAETEFAERIAALMPAVEVSRMVNSGTEAAMSAIRIARAFVGRELLVKFEGCYHGHADSLLVAAGSGALTLGRPSSAGVTAGAARDTLILPFNDAAAARDLFAARGAEIAAVIVEPIAGNMNMVVPDADFLRALRECCDAHGAVLIFDEVMSGFRVAAGGAQEIFGIRPDLTCLGKVVGGGLPAAVFGGRREVMAAVAPQGPAYQAGTLSGNPLATAAGIAALKIAAAEGFYENLNRRARQLVDGLNAAGEKTGAPFCAQSAGGMLGIYFRATPPRNFAEVNQCDTKRFAKFFRAMLDRGVYLPPSPFEAAFLTAAHGDEEIEKTVAAAEESLRASG